MDELVLSLRREYGRLLTNGGLQGLIVYAGIQIGEPIAWVFCAGLIAAVSLFAWISTYQRSRAIRDTPTSKIASAAQGYAEIIGRGRALGGTPVVSQLRHLPCLWYRYTVEHRRDKDHWEMESQGESDASFLVEDGTGECLVDPAGADIVSIHRERWHETDRRYFEEWLGCNDEVYVLGEFKTRNADDLKLDRDEVVKSILDDWKRNRPELLRRFDLDGDGEIDMKEWELARAQARREANQIVNETAASSGIHMLQKPADGRLYLISAKPQEELASSFSWWSVAHITLFFGGLIGAVVAYRMAG
ncbi:MAG TPA: GIDE domain-containing protein [Rhodocyclaceae bacterium]